MQKPVAVKIVVVGDGVVGKTCMLVSYTEDKFPEEYVPTVFQNYSATLKIGNKMVNLGLWDTAGQEEYAKLRTLAYSNCDLFLIVFDVTEQSTFKNTCKKWLPQLNDIAPNVVKLVVGNKIDRRSPDDPKHVKREVAELAVRELGSEYRECSAKTQEGLKAVFDHGIRQVLSRKEPESKNECCTVQ